MAVIMSAVTTHVLDTSQGRPASGVFIELERQRDDGTWLRLGSGYTDGDGRLRTLLPDKTAASAGIYRMTFNTGAYFSNLKQMTFYPQVIVYFEIDDTSQHYHVPLLLSPFGYSTYRGS